MSIAIYDLSILVPDWGSGTWIKQTIPVCLVHRFIDNTEGTRYHQKIAGLESPHGEGITPSLQISNDPILSTANRLWNGISMKTANNCEHTKKYNRTQTN
jgi:hypothetical protein